MNKSLDRLTLLATFARIVERGSISAAARDLGLSQPSASRHLAELETRFGTQLVRRTTHELGLTPAGQDLLSDARHLLDDWQALEERHGDAGNRVRGRLKIVAPVALGQGELAHSALAFQRTHPEVALTWILDDKPIRFAETGCDCWIKIGSVPDDTLIVKPLGKVERLVVAAPDLANHVRSTEDLKTLPCAALDPFEGGRIELSGKGGPSITLSPPVAWSTNNIVALKQAVLAGVGFAVMPRWFVEAELVGGALVDILPDWRAPTLTIHAAYAPARFQPMRLKVFLQTIVERVPLIKGVEPS